MNKPFGMILDRSKAVFNPALVAAAKTPPQPQSFNAGARCGKQPNSLHPFAPCRFATGTKIKHTETSQKYEEAARNPDTIQLKHKIPVIFMVTNCNKWDYHSMNWN